MIFHFHKTKVSVNLFIVLKISLASHVTLLVIVIITCIHERKSITSYNVCYTNGTISRGSPGTELEFVIMVIAVSCVKLLSAPSHVCHFGQIKKTSNFASPFPHFLFSFLVPCSLLLLLALTCR